MLGGPYPAGFPEMPFQVKGQISHKGEPRRRVIAVYGVAEGQKARLKQIVKHPTPAHTQPRILMEIPGRLLPDKRLHLLPQSPISHPARFDFRRPLAIGAAITILLFHPCWTGQSNGT